MEKSLSDIRELFSKKALWQSWLDVESSLAKVQAELKIIPEEAAREIAAKANLDHVNAGELAEDIKRT